MFGIEKLNKTINKLESRIDEYDRNNNILKTQIDQCNVKNSSLRQENAVLKSKLRTETEADIFFSCVKISKKLIDGASKKDVKEEVDYRNSFMNALAQQQQSLSCDSGVLSRIGI